MFFDIDEDWQDEENNEQNAEPSTQQQYDDVNAMRHFCDHVAELMWTYRQQN